MTPIKIQQSQSKLDSEPWFTFVVESIKDGNTNSWIASELTQEGCPTTRDSVRRFRKRHGLGVTSTPNQGSKSGVTLTDDSGVITSAVTEGTNHSSLNDPDAMLLERNLDPKSWKIDRATINEWSGPGYKGGPTKTYKQAKLNIVRKKPEVSLLPARSDGWIAPRTYFPATWNSYLAVMVGDQQCPFQDKLLNELFCSWLEYNQPDVGVLTGDTVDYPDISKHPADPENNVKVNECNQSAYDVLRGYVNSSPNTYWRMLEGNHDFQRIRATLMKQAPNLYGIARASVDDSPMESVLSLSHLLRLDELGIDLIDPHGSYEHGIIQLSKYLAVRHGWIAVKGSGTSALKTLEHLGYSVVVGHTHRQSLVHKTTHDIDGNPTTLAAAETGCMCRIDDGRIIDDARFPNYCVAPDHQQGFATASMNADETFHLELATFTGGKLYWRDQVYS